MKIAPTVSLKVVGTRVQLFGPDAVGGLGLGVQFEDHPPKAPVPAGAVRVRGVPMGYVATQTEPPEPVQPGPQWITFGVPVADGAVMYQLVVFRPSLYTVTVDSRADACEPG